MDIRVKQVAAYVFAALLLGCASSATTETPYNRGVAAYKVKNYKEAVSNWSTAAESGNVDAMNNLAFLLFNGLGTEAQPEKAIELWRVAASQGQSESQWHLGNAYADGTGVEKSLTTAYAWYRCSIESAERHSRESTDTTENQIADDARKSLVGITDKLSGNELEQGNQLATQYIEKYAPVAQPSLPANQPSTGG